MKLSGKAYDVWKFIATIGLPASIALYGTLASIWGWPYRSAILATAGAVVTFLNAVLMIDSHQYWKNKEIIDLTGEEEE